MAVDCCVTISDSLPLGATAKGGRYYDSQSSSIGVITDTGFTQSCPLV